MNCLIYRVYNTYKNEKAYDERALTEKLKKILDPDGIHLVCRRDATRYVLVRYEFEDPLSMDEISSHFAETTQKIGELSDEINCELGIQSMITFSGTVVTPDSMVKKPKSCGSCDCLPKEDKDEAGDDSEDEWAEVKRLRDIGAKH